MNIVVLILIVLLIAGAFGSLPMHPYSTNWGYGPSGILSIVLVVVLILFLMGRL